MKCPNCKLENPPSGLRCDCGYDFPTGTLKESYLKKPHSFPNNESTALMREVNGQRKTRWFSWLACLVIMMAAGSLSAEMVSTAFHLPNEARGILFGNTGKLALGLLLICWALFRPRLHTFKRRALASAIAGLAAPVLFFVMAMSHG